MVCFQFHLKPHFKIVIVAGIASTVSACGGGGGGGGGSVGGAISRLPITITNPDPGVVIEPSALELANTPSLGDVAAASVYHLGVSGEGITPDLIILDTGLADIKGLSGLARIHEATQKKIPVAIMGAPTSQSEMRMVLEAGAVGYIPKNIGIKAFYSAITLMAEGEIFLPADHGTHRSENSFLPNNWLTGREQDMLAGLLAGKSNKEIARKHGLSEVTVKHHLKSLRGKLGAKNRTHAVCRAIELGIVPE